MTQAVKQQNVDWIKRNSISLTTMILVIGLFWKQASWQQKMEDNVEVLEEHRKSPLVHMPLTEKLEIFVTRNEFIQMKKTVETTNENVKLLLNNELNKKL